MLLNVCRLLVLVAAVTARQDLHKSQTSVKDQDIANDQVTSILLQPGPNGPRHVVLSSDHQVIHSDADDNTPFQSGHFAGIKFHNTPPPPRHVTYGPARPVALRPHQGFAYSKPLHYKDDRKSLSDAIYKYSTVVNHAKLANDEEDKRFYSGEANGPDYSVTVDGRGSYEPEGLSAYRESDSSQVEGDEDKYRASIGDGYDNDYEQRTNKPLPFSKLYFNKQFAYVPLKSNDNKIYNLNDGPYHDAPSGFNDHTGGKVAPILARFYKQPLPVIQTQLPLDNVGGLYFQYFPIHRAVNNKPLYSNRFQHFPQDRADAGNQLESSASDWTPINAPSGAVPAKSYDIPAPDLSRAESVVVGKSVGSQIHHGNSEGVVSAVVRVKQ